MPGVAMRAGARWIIERELDLVHLARYQSMAGAAEDVVKLLVGAARQFPFQEVKAEEPVAKFQSVLQRRDDLLVDAGADDERINDSFDRMRLVFIERDMVPQVAGLAVNPPPAGSR